MRALAIALMLAAGCGRLRFDARDDAAPDDGSIDATPACTTSGIVQLSTGRFYSCGRYSDGAVRCWGRNTNNQLGAPGPTSLTPVTITLPGAAISIDAGAFHACAALADGRAYCWGRNNEGELGDGSTSVRNTPVQVMSLPAVDEVIAASRHSCARVRGDGRVFCWGQNIFNELGNQSNTPSPLPVQVFGLTGTTSLAAGHRHTCAINSNRTVSCWGSNSGGQLGDNTTAVRSMPVTVMGLANVQALAAGGKFTCALRTDGTAACWGVGSDGQLGVGDYVNRPMPGPNIPVTGITAIGAGVRHACVASPAGVQCFGDNGRGQIGDGTLSQGHTTPATPFAGGTTPQLFGGYYHNCALGSDGAIACWGSNTNGELGNGVRAIRAMPGLVSLPAPAAELAITDGAACARLTDGEVRCWGVIPDIDGSTTPVAIPLANVQRLSLGYSFACGIVGGGGVHCLGENYTGQLGDGTFADHSTPMPVASLANVSAITSGGESTCAITGGAVRCWGRNNAGQLGDGTTTTRNMPVAAGTLADAVSIVMGPRHVCALRGTGGVVACWGDNDAGAIGNGSTTSPLTTPTQVSTVTAATLIGVGGNHSCAVAGTSLSCWGANYNGQLGDGTRTERRSPVPITSGSITSLGLGEDHTCMVSNEQVSCWGSNGNGQLGADAEAVRDRTTPAIVAGLPAMQQVVGGNTFSCGISTPGDVYCWGLNSNGQLGDGLPPPGGVPRVASVLCP